MHIEITGDDLGDPKIVNALRALLDSASPRAVAAQQEITATPQIKTTLGVDASEARAAEPAADEPEPETLAQDDGGVAAYAAFGGTLPTTAPSEPPVYDSTGVMWDPDHHAGSKATTADGTWRARRGGPAPGAKPLVTRDGGPPASAAAAPLPPVSAAPTAPAPPAPPVSAPPASPPSPAPSASSPLPPPAPSPPGTPAADAPVTAPVITAAQVFADAMRHVTDAQNAGVTPEEIQSVVTGLGLTAVRDLFKASDKAPAFIEQIDALAQAAKA